MLFGLIVSFVGSMLGVVAWNFPSLVAARLIQAVATGLYFPVVNEALLNLSPKNGAGRLLAVNSGIIGIGLAVAPIVAGLVITYWGLRVLFAIPTVAAFVLFFIARRTIVDIMPRQKLPVDGLSVVLIAVGLSAFMIGLNEVTRNPLPMAALMIAGIVVCAWFIHRQGRLAHPLLDMRPLRNKTYALGETLIVLSYMSSIYLSLLIPLYLEGVAGFTPFIAGCLLAPATLCYAGLCFVSGRMLGKAGVWPLVPVGFGVCLVGFVALAVFTRLDLALAIVGCMALACAGIGTEYPAIKSVDLEVLDPAVRERLVDPFHFGADRRIYFVGALRRSHVGAGSSFDGRWHGESAGLQRRFLDHRVPGGRLCSGSGHLIGGLRAPCGQADPWEVGHRRICRMGKGSPMPSVSERSNTSKP